MPLYDSKGRKVEEGNRIWLTMAPYEPYTAFRERPRDFDPADLPFLFAEYKARPNGGKSVASAR